MPRVRQRSARRSAPSSWSSSQPRCLAVLWIGVTRGLLVELAAGLDPDVAGRAAERFFTLLRNRRDRPA